MNDSDKKSFSVALSDLQMKCQGELSTEKLRAYWGDLQTYSIQQVEAACRALARQPGRIFFPSVGEFIAILNGSSEANAQEAWHKVVESTSRGFHRRNPPVFDDPKIQRALDAIGGYSLYCDTSYSEQHWLQDRFVKAYETVSDSTQRQEIQQIGRDEAVKLLSKIGLSLPAKLEETNE